MRRRELLSGLFLLGGGRMLSGVAPLANLPSATPGPLCRTDGAGMEICEARSCAFVSSIMGQAQENSKWCWAACLEMAFYCLGHTVSQQTIVKATWGDIRNAPASPEQVVQTVNRDYVDAAGRRFRPKARLVDRTYGFFTNLTALGATFDHMSSGKPTIIGSISAGGTGHATMLTILTVRRALGAKTLPDFRSAYVYDPWPADLRARTREFTLEEWNQSPFIILVDI
jgi:hypothetical protein